MPKEKKIYTCSHCDAQYPRWEGYCRECDKYNTIDQDGIISEIASDEERSRFRGFSTQSDVQDLTEINSANMTRIPSGMSELDRVLGGGWVQGGSYVLYGSPGVGKTTLATGFVSCISSSHTAMYVSGEENAEQIKARCVRLGVGDINLKVFAENNYEKIIEAAKKVKPNFIVIDSIQTIYTTKSASHPGSTTQVRESASSLTRWCKENNAILVMIAHVTKAGEIAGPQALQHIGDGVFSIEGNTDNAFRIVRAEKNRFGPVPEVGFFEMGEHGLIEVKNPGAIFIERTSEDTTGSVIVAIQETTRSILVEIQALVNASQSSKPVREAIGLSSQRLTMILAILSKHAGIALEDLDVFVSVIGGYKVGADPSADLAIALALISSFRNIPIDSKMVVFGEMALSGALRQIPSTEMRLGEIERLGFTNVIHPQNKQKFNRDFVLNRNQPINIEDAIQCCFSDFSKQETA